MRRIAIWIIHTIIAAGYIGILLLMFVETIVPVLPSEVVMAAAGVAVAHGTLRFWPLVLACAVGATLGNLVWYTLGNRLGYERLHPWVQRHGRWLTLEWPDVERGTRFLRKYGFWVVGAIRVSPVLRTMISLPAGLVHMNRWLFIAVTLIGTAVWNGLWIASGNWLAPHVAAWQHQISWTVGGVIAAVLAIYAWRVTHWQARV